MAICDIECPGKGKLPGEKEYHPEYQEFVGPVKVVLVDTTSDDHFRKTFVSALVTMAVFLLGPTCFTVIYFSLSFKLSFSAKAHIFLCTIGFQLLLMSGNMMFSSYFGGAANLKPQDRKMQHYILELGAVVTGIMGSVFAVGCYRFTIHMITGYVSLGLVIVTSFVLGPRRCALYNSEKLFTGFRRLIHRYAAVLTTLVCSVCFILGLLENNFISWALIPYLHYILIGFCVYYTIVTLALVFLRAKYGT